MRRKIKKTIAHANVLIGQSIALKNASVELVADSNALRERSKKLIERINLSSASRSLKPRSGTTKAVLEPVNINVPEHCPTCHSEGGRTTAEIQ